MPWHKNYDENTVLERAMTAFWKQGYEATSMGDLVTATGINRGSIYAAFNSKRELFLRSLRHYDAVHREDHLQRIAALYDPKNAIIAVFQSAAQKPDNRKLPWGCLLVNTALELSPHDTEVAEFVAHSLCEVQDFFQTCIESAQSDATIDSSIDARETAQGLLGLFLGLRVLTRSGAPRSSLDGIISQARVMLE